MHRAEPPARARFAALAGIGWLHPFPHLLLCSAEQREQALLLVAATRSALEALPPAASSVDVPGLACGTLKQWLTHPNSLRSAPAVLRQLVGLLEQALERWLQVCAKCHLHYGLYQACKLWQGQQGHFARQTAPLHPGEALTVPSLACVGPLHPGWSASVQDIRRAAGRAAAGCRPGAPGGCLPGAPRPAGLAGALRCPGWPGGRRGQAAFTSAVTCDMQLPCCTL